MVSYSVWLDEYYPIAKKKKNTIFDYISWQLPSATPMTIDESFNFCFFVFFSSFFCAFRFILATVNYLIHVSMKDLSHSWTNRLRTFGAKTILIVVQRGKHKTQKRQKIKKIKKHTQTQTHHLINSYFAFGEFQHGLLWCLYGDGWFPTYTHVINDWLPPVHIVDFDVVGAAAVAAIAAVAAVIKTAGHKPKKKKVQIFMVSGRNFSNLIAIFFPILYGIFMYMYDIHHIYVEIHLSVYTIVYYGMQCALCILSMHYIM